MVCPGPGSVHQGAQRLVIDSISDRVHELQFQFRNSLLWCVPVHILELQKLEVEGRLQPDQFKEAKSEILAAFERLWGQGVLHGDVAARNILVRRDSYGHHHVVIYDFGLSQCCYGKIPECRQKREEESAVHRLALGLE